MSGYLKIYRSILEWEWYSDINTFRLFLHLLFKVNWKEGNFKGTKIERGSLVSSVGRLALETGLTQQEVKTALKHLKKTGEVTSKATSKYTVFTVVKYNQYQADNQQLTDEQPATNEQSTNEQPTSNQQLTTIEEGKKERREEGKKDLKDIIVQPEDQPAPAPQQLDQSTDVVQGRNPISQQPDKSADAQKDIDTVKAILEVLNQKAGTNYQSRSKDTQKHIRARLREGYTLDDFVKVIDIKVKEWGHEPAIGEKDMRPYLRPATLFGPKFESYLNQKLTPAASKITQIKPNAFHNFEQRTYDYGDLEKRFIKKANSVNIDLPLPKQG